METRSYLGCVLFGLCSLLAGCAGLSDIANQAKTAAIQSIDDVKAQVGGGSKSYHSVLDTEMSGVFKKYPISKTDHPEVWPRAAVTITRATPGVLAMQFNGEIGANECMTVNIRFWKDASTSQDFDDVSICADYFAKMQNMSLGPLMLWPGRQFWPNEKNSGSVRNNGPMRPMSNAPTDADSALWFQSGHNGLFFFAALFYQMGYDWNDLYDRRVWIVSVPSTAGG